MIWCLLGVALAITMQQTHRDHHVSEVFAIVPQMGLHRLMPKDDCRPLSAVPSGSAGVLGAKRVTSEAIAPLLGAVGAAVLAAGSVLAVARGGSRKSKTSAVQCNAFGSGSSGFFGAQTMTSYAMTAAPEPVMEDFSYCSGLRSMTMKGAQTWFVTNRGFDGKTSGKVFDWKRRESRRRGEELFRHDVDNFELNLNNLIGAPGSRRKRQRRGRGKYGCRGRSCGYGTGGAKKRGRRVINPWYEGGATAINTKFPKLSQEQIDSMKADTYTSITMDMLNMCADGDEVDLMDLYVRGFPVKVKSIKGFTKYLEKVRVKARETDECTVKNLTVYAHAFEPAAREKIERNGGRCIRLSDVGNLPIDEARISVNLIPLQEMAAAPSS